MYSAEESAFKIKEQADGHEYGDLLFSVPPIVQSVLPVSVKSLWHLLCCSCERHAYDLEKIMLC